VLRFHFGTPPVGTSNFYQGDEFLTGAHVPWRAEVAVHDHGFRLGQFHEIYLQRNELRYCIVLERYGVRV
jgi:hypothetical protein